MSQAPAIVRSPRDQWLAARRELLTASDCAAVLGQDERRGPLAVYLAKVEGVEAEDKVFMRRGRRFEGAIADEYAEQMGRPVGNLGEFEIQRHPDVRWLGATWDRVTCESEQSPGPVKTPACDVPLQIKLAIGSAHAWREGPPTGVLIQVQIEASCTRAPWAAVAALVGPGPLAASDHLRDDAFLAVAMPKLEEFWLRVQRREPPEADALPGTTEILKRAWSTDNGATVALDHEAQGLADKLAGVRSRVANAEHEAQGIENQLRARLGAASFGACPDGSFLTLITTKRDGYTVQPTTYRALKRKWPRLRRR